MRASATSKTASPANVYASQAKGNANKADAASPFALLLESTAPSQAAKPAKKDTQESADKKDGKSVVSQAANQDNKADAAPATVQSKSTPTDKPADKPEKSDKSGKGENQ
ncbi:MAG TPA: hypothetical protein VNN98_01015, partial [Rhizomicrobium sp.]|nr:hypothetical protein [Rhizomicrobium sp.]